MDGFQLQCINCQAQWPAYSKSVYEIVRAESSPCPKCGGLTLEHSKVSTPAFPGMSQIRRRTSRNRLSALANA